MLKKITTFYLKALYYQANINLQITVNSVTELLVYNSNKNNSNNQ